MKLAYILVVAAVLSMTGCASVDMATKEESSKAKEFGLPRPGTAGVYIYRDSFAGKALKKDVWIDGKCIGQSAPDVFFYAEVDGGRTHKIDTDVGADSILTHPAD